MGDPGGIGPEVTAKALSSIKPKDKNVRYKIIGDDFVFKHYRKRLPSYCEFYDVGRLTQRRWSLGKITKANGNASLEYLHVALDLLKQGVLQGLVTAPVAKEAIVKTQSNFIGHTELLAQHASTEHVGMMFVAEKLRTIIVTRHIPLKQVPKEINAQIVFDTINLTHNGLKQQFKIAHPRIAVCGLNPHAGENGLMGDEDVKQIVPAIKRARRRGMDVSGPYPADTLFVREKSRNYDCMVAMYHDQGLIPIKTLYFNELVNLTIGLPYIRTSPAHGTAFDIAGKNRANPSSMIHAIKLAEKLSLL